MHNFISDRAGEMSRERSRGQPGTIEIRPGEPREWNAPGSHGGFAWEYSGGIRQGFEPGTQCSGSVAVVFRHGALLSKERPAIDA